MTIPNVKVPTDIDEFAKGSMKVLNISPGEDWSTARDKLAMALIDEGGLVYIDVCQVIAGEYVGAAYPFVDTVMRSLLPALEDMDKDTVALYLDVIVKDLWKK